MISVYQQHHAPHFPCRRLCHIRLHLPCRSQSGHQDAITAYFDSAGREVTVFPCPNFDSFIADTSLMYRGMLFITNLPRYIIPAGIQILEANIYITSPHFDWLPNPPNLLSFQPSSRSTYTSRNSPSQRSRSLLSHQDSFVGRRPDPDRINSYPLHHSNPHAPVQNIHMGGNLASHGGSCGGMSPLTFWNSGSVAGRALERTLASHGGSYGGMSPLTFQNSGSVAGGASIASLRPMGGVGGASVVPLEIFSTSAMVSPAPAFVNLAQPDTSSVLGRRCPSHYVAGRHHHQRQGLRFRAQGYHQQRLVDRSQENHQHQTLSPSILSRSRLQNPSHNKSQRRWQRLVRGGCQLLCQAPNLRPLCQGILAWRKGVRDDCAH